MEGSREVQYKHYENGRWLSVEGTVPDEKAVRLHVNGQEFATLMCTPRELDHLVLGFLCNEGLIEDLADVRVLKVCPSGACVDVWLRKAEMPLPSVRTITSGCGGGVTFADLTAGVSPLASTQQVTAAQICALMSALTDAGELYRHARGVHTAALARGADLLAVAEDVGRHNTIDKLRGRCLVDGIETEDAILLSTGRISSEMLYKAARMQTPVIASRTSPTHLAVALATAWNLTLIGYVRHASLHVYTSWQRLNVTEGEESTYVHA